MTPVPNAHINTDWTVGGAGPLGGERLQLQQVVTISSVVTQLTVCLPRFDRAFVPNLYPESGLRGTIVCKQWSSGP